MGLLGSELPDQGTTCKQHKAGMLKHLMFISLNLQLEPKSVADRQIQFKRKHYYLILIDVGTIFYCYFWLLNI